MPLYYEFVRASNGEKVLLHEIDALICDDFGIPCSDDVFSSEFQMISNIGDVVWKTETWNQRLFDHLVERNDQKSKDIILKYLNGEYVYSCWVCR